MANRSLTAILNESSPGKLPTALQQARAGTLLSLSPRFAKGAVAADVLVLPEGARAAAILMAYATAGTIAGFKTPIHTGAAPATLQCSINAVGNILFNDGTDDVTAAEVVYVAEEGDVIEEVIAVASNSGTPLAGRNVRRLLEAEALAGTGLGAKTVLTRGAAAGSAGQAAANAAGTAVIFNATDAVTSARIKYIATPGVGSQLNKPGVVGALATEDKGY